MTGTIKHSKASKARWANVPDDVKKKRMSKISKAGWDALPPKARRKRALKGVQTRQAKIK